MFRARYPAIAVLSHFDEIAVALIVVWISWVFLACIRFEGFISFLGFLGVSRLDQPDASYAGFECEV